MKKDIIKLECGHEVEVIAIDISRTYGEFLVGEPRFEDNIYVYENLKAPNHWGIRKTVKNTESFDLDLKHFKKYTIYLWLASNKSVNDPKKKFDGSELVIIGTFDSINNFSVPELIEDVLKDFDWEKYAINIRL